MILPALIEQIDSNNRLFDVLYHVLVTRNIIYKW